MIEVKHLNKRFGNKVLFQDLSFTINDGEFFCFSGASGTGKTTMLNMLGLIEPFDSGSLTIDGNQYKSKNSKRQFFGKTAGFLFQNFVLMENKTVRENLELIPPMYLEDISVEESLTMVGLEGTEDRKVYSLSGGEQQRVSLARLYRKQCKIIYADEPTGSLDRGNADIVMNILKALNESGKTIILVTHDEICKQYAEKVFQL